MCLKPTTFLLQLGVRKILKILLTVTIKKWECRFKYVLPSGELRTHLGNGTSIFLANDTILFNFIILNITQEVKNKVLPKQASTMACIDS